MDGEGLDKFMIKLITHSSHLTGSREIYLNPQAISVVEQYKKPNDSGCSLIIMKNGHKYIVECSASEVDYACRTSIKLG